MNPFPKQLQEYMDRKCVERTGLMPDQYIDLIKNLGFTSEEDIDKLDKALYRRYRESEDGSTTEISAK